MRDGERTPGKVAIFSTCYINYNEPGIGLDLIAVLAHNEIPYRVVEKEACCGMPKLELGDLEAVERLKDVNIPALAALARDGHAILTAVPSCTLMFKQELPLLFPDDDDVRVVADAMFDPFEYLVLRDKDGLLRRDFVRAARQGQLPHSVSLARAERRAEDARGAGVDPGYDRPHGRALRRARRHVRREERVLRGVDEDRQAGVQPDGAARAGFRELGLPDRRAAHPAGHHRGGQRQPRAQGASAVAVADGLRTRDRRPIR